MKNHSIIRTTSFSILICGTAFLTGCQTDSASQQSAPPAPTQSGLPQVGFSSDVSPVAIDACRSALAQEASSNDIQVTGTEFSQANSAVYMTLGPQRAPWRCLVSNDGQVAEVTFMGSEGAL